MRIENLQRKYRQYMSKGDYARAMQVARQIEEIQEQKQLERQPLTETLSTAEQRNQVTYDLIPIIVLTDILYGRVMDYEAKLKKLGIYDMELLNDIKSTVSTCKKVVTTIDTIGNAKLSEHYANLTDDIENSIMPAFLNQIYTLIAKRIKFE